MSARPRPRQDHRVTAVIVSGAIMTSPVYIRLLFETFTGNVVLVACGLWMLIGILVMRKMINFEM